jgi:hypothetical protein
VLDRLAVSDAEERSSLLVSLKKYRHAYSRDGSFSSRQLQESAIFFSSSSTGNVAAQKLNLEEMVNDTWVGRSK